MQTAQFNEAVKLAGLPIPESRLEILGNDPIYYSPFKLGAGSAVVHGLVGSKIDELWQLQGHSPQSLRIDMRHSAASLNSMSWLSLGNMPENFRNQDMTRIYRCGDGRYFHLHRSFHDAPIVANQIGVDEDADLEAIATAMAKQNSFELEAALISKKVTGAVVRSPEEWRRHPQGQFLRDKPVVEITKIGEGPVESLKGGERPLSNLRVLDLTRVLAGPVSARTLAEHGAQVMHVASPSLPTMEMAEMDTGHGKRQIHLDLNKEDDVETLMNLAKNTDVFNQGFRKGTLDRRGFGPEAMAKLRPGLIYVSENCYGHGGPWSERPGWEQLAQTVSGIAQMQGELAPLEPDWDRAHAAGTDPSVPRLAPAPMNDYSTAYFAAYGVLEALRRRATEGGSWHVQVSLTQTAMWYLKLGVNSASDLAPLLPMARETNIFSKELQKETLYKLIEKPPAANVTGNIEHFFESHETGYGQMRHLSPVLEMSDTQPHWEFGSRPLGSDTADWE